MSPGAFDPATLSILLFLATFVTEDATCIVAGSLAATGAIGLDLAVAACFCGIFASDLGLYLIGRISGKAAARSSLFRRFVKPSTLENGARWLERRGPSAIFISRFISGLRLPTYLAAGFLKVNFPRFALYFLIAAAIWTPVLVGSAYYAQTNLFGSQLAIGALLLFAMAQIVFALLSRKRRKRLAGSIRKLYRWEFWPVQIFYVPVVLYVLFLGIRYRSFTLFTAANPAIPFGGFSGESKDAIYRGLGRSGAAMPHLLQHAIVDPGEMLDLSIERIEEFLKVRGLGYPLAVKPDSGERGKGVRIVQDAEGLVVALGTASGPQIFQEFAPGEEFSVFYFRYPGKENGRIFSITEKIFPEVEGDGSSTIEELILDDPRAVCMHGAYLDNIEDNAHRVPRKGERVKLIEIGTHSRGAIFKDGDWVRSDELEKAIDSICRGYKGFNFGRFDLRTPSVADLQRGTGFKIVELNGVTSESTNIYDRRYSLADAYRLLFRQWTIAFEIGRLNRDLGFDPSPFRSLVALCLFGSRADLFEETA